VQHILRTGENRFPKILINYKPEGHREIERPKSRWKDELN
jgi:hypothetical protein